MIELEFILLFIMISSYIWLIGSFVSQGMNSFLREEDSKKDFRLDILFTALTTFLYLAQQGYERQNVVMFLMGATLCLVIGSNFINYALSFFKKDIDTQLILLKEKKNIKFYIRLVNPHIKIMLFSIIISFLIAEFVPVLFIYKILIVIAGTQIISFLIRAKKSTKIAYYDYLVDIIGLDDYDKVRIQDLLNYSKIKDFSVFELFIVEKIMHQKREEVFFLIDKNNNLKLSNILRIKALIRYKMYSLIKVTGEDRLILDNKENIIIEVLKSIQLKDFYKAEILFNKLSLEDKLYYEDLMEVISSNKTISFDEHYDDVNYYIIENEDYSRTNDMEKYFHKYVKFKLLDAFGNKCAKSQADTELEMDHFFVPKSLGGNFIMKRKDGKFVLNAIPLHKAINQNKSNNNYKDYFTPQEVEEIFKKINHLNDELNQKGIDL